MNELPKELDDAYFEELADRINKRGKMLVTPRFVKVWVTHPEVVKKRKEWEAGWILDPLDEVNQPSPPNQHQIPKRSNQQKP